MDADRSINECILCKEHLKDKHPKLLSCLHSVCETCFKTLFKTIDVSESKKNEETSEQGEKSETIEDDVKVDNKGNEKTGPREENWLEIKEINCPVCDTIVNKEYVVENLFALTDDVTKQTSGEDEEDMIIEKNEVHICTGCEEEQAAASFCEDCREWLCDQCVFAHRRVRITKDHTITLKAEGSKDEDSASNRGMAMFCQKHKNEPLKLFCETCDLLTCRDCQLLEHKDHKYQFMSDAIIHQRELLQDVVTKVKTKLNNYTQAEKILQKKNDELKGKLDEVCTNITEVTQTVVKKLEEHSDMLIQHLSKYISGKVNVIGDKMRLVKEAILKMDHVVHFVDNALTLGDDMSILYTKGTMMKVLEQLGKTGIPFQHAILQYSVSFEYDKESIAKNTCGVGHLVIDNVRYPSKSGASVTANVVAPTQTMNNNNNSSSIVPRNVPRHTVQPVLPNITMLPEEVQNHILSLPAEKQHETALKLQAAYNKNRPMQQSLPSNSAFPNVGSGSTHAPQSARGYGSMSVPMNTPPFRPRTSNTFLGNQLQRPQNIFGSNYTSSPGQASQYAPRPMHPQGMHPGPISTYATAGITTNPMSAMAASVGGASLVSHGNMSFSANSNAISHPLTSNLSGFQQETILNNRHQVADTCSFSREQGSWYSHVDTNSQSRTSPLQSSQQRFSPGSLEPRSAHVHKTSVPPTGPQNPISPVAPTFAKQDHNERPSCAFNQVRASKRVLGLLLKKVTSGKRNLLSEGAKFQVCEKPVSLQKRNLSSDRVECKECGKTFSVRSNLNRHLNSCHRKLRFRCLKCNRRYGYLTNLKRHEKVCLKQKKPINIRTKFVLEKISSVKGNLSSSGAKNEECEKSFSFKSGNLLSEVVYTCQDCGKTSPAQNENLSSVGAHCQECGNTSLPRNENLSSDGFECKECGKTYSRRSGLNRHFNSCHRKLRFRCLKCKKGYGYLTSLKRHEKICFKRKTHKTVSASTRLLGLLLKKNGSLSSNGVECQVCKKNVFSQNGNLSSESFQCQECEKSVIPQDGNLSSEGVKCQDCGKAFLPQNGNISSDGLKCRKCEKSVSHEIGNVSSEDVRCQECGKTFPLENGNISSHGLKCQECEKLVSPVIGNLSLEGVRSLECGKSFSSQILNHSSKGVKCPECGKTFSRRSNLKSHFNSSHRKLRFRCLKCNRGFGYISNLKRHKKICLRQKTHKTVRTRVLLEKVTSDKRNLSTYRSEGQECGKLFSFPIGNRLSESGKCQVCGKTFLLQNVVLSSDGVKCHECEKLFSPQNGKLSSDGATFSRQSGNLSSNGAKCHEGGKTFFFQDGNPSSDDVGGQECEKSFSSQIGNLSSDGVKCSECGKTFSRRSNLICHFNSSHRKLRFRCLKCNRGFGYISNLKRHEKICSKQKTHKTVRTRVLLEKVTFDKKNYSSNCAEGQECEKSFPTQIGNLSSEGVKCPECGKTFSRRSNLKSHFNSSHRKLGFRCLKCNRGFGYISNLKRHEKICLKQKTRKTKHATAAPQRSSPMPPPIPQPPPLVRKQTPPPQQLVRNEPSPSPSKVSAGGGKTMPESATFDPNEDYCAVCQNGGDLLCCDICPKVFHLKCHVPELDTYPSGDWCCSLCTKKDDQQILVEKEKKEDFYLATGKRKAPSGLSDRELKACERILLGLYCHPNSTVFHQQVSKSVPNYYKIIVNPMDFGKIKLKLQRQNFNHYSTVEEFLSDIHLVFKNCRIYNDIASEIWKIGKKVEEEAEELIRLYMPCYSDYFDELLDKEDKERRAGLLGLDSIMKTFHPDETRQETPTPDTVPSSVADSQFAKKQRVEEVHEEIL